MRDKKEKNITIKFPFQDLHETTIHTNQSLFRYIDNIILQLYNNKYEAQYMIYDCFFKDQNKECKYLTYNNIYFMTYNNDPLITHFKLYNKDYHQNKMIVFIQKQKKNIKINLYCSYKKGQEPKQVMITTQQTLFYFLVKHSPQTKINKIVHRNQTLKKKYLHRTISSLKIKNNDNIYLF